MIPRLLKELNLETKIKNKVHEILDKNGYFRETSQITATKFKNCKNMSQLPGYFFDKDCEPLENVAAVRKQWNEILKSKLMTGLRYVRKPMASKKRIPVKGVPKKQEEPSETRSHHDSGSGDSDDDNPREFERSQAPPTSNDQQKKLPPDAIYDHNHLYEHIMKLQNSNFAGNTSLSWGKIKLQLATRSLDELRRKYYELNVNLRQIGVDEEKSFVDERIIIGERLLQKDY